MNGINQLISLGSKGSDILSQKYNKETLKKLLAQFQALEKNNNNAFNNMINKSSEGFSLSELKTVWETKENLGKLRDMVSDAIFNIERMEIEKINKNSVFIVNHEPISIPTTNIEISQKEIKPLEKEIFINKATDKQFLYNRNNLKVTNEICFSTEIVFDVMAPIPLRLTNNQNFNQ